MPRGYDPPPSYYEPEETPPPVCPICGQETDTFRMDFYGDIIGCDRCVKDVDAWYYRREHE